MGKLTKLVRALIGYLGLGLWYSFIFPEWSSFQIIVVSWIGIILMEIIFYE